MLIDPNAAILQKLSQIADALDKPAPSPWHEWLSNVSASFVANVAAGILFVFLYVIIQWFLAATDITIGYAWRFDGNMERPSNLRPHFDIRNRSRSKTYYLANIAYLVNGRPVASFDNQSVWDTELKPGTIIFLEAAPMRNPSFASLQQCLATEVHVRLQNGRSFWLRGQGPGQLKVGRIQRAAFWLRNKIEHAAVPME